MGGEVGKWPSGGEGGRAVGECGRGGARWEGRGNKGRAEGGWGMGVGSGPAYTFMPLGTRMR